jgi:hypothetical protein
MDNKLLDCEVYITCEAVGCFKKATSKINVKAGQLGSFPLDLCIECVKKFRQDISREEDLKQKIIRNEEDKGR